MNILTIEDEPQLATHMIKAMQSAGHDARHSSDGINALEQLHAHPYDLVVLDVNLPGCDGFEVLKKMRHAGNNARVIMLTARNGIHDRITGLKSGADDYLTKPFAMEELLARIEALGRRGGVTDERDILRSGDLIFDLKERRLTRNGEPISLSPRESEVLRILISEPGRTFSRHEICERIWQREHEYDTRTVEIFIMRLRKKLDNGSGKTIIETVRGTGYRLRSE